MHRSTFRNWQRSWRVKERAGERRAAEAVVRARRAETRPPRRHSRKRDPTLFFKRAFSFLGVPTRFLPATCTQQTASKREHGALFFQGTLESHPPAPPSPPHTHFPSSPRTRRPLGSRALLCLERLNLLRFRPRLSASCPSSSRPCRRRPRSSRSISKPPSGPWRPSPPSSGSS